MRVIMVCGPYRAETKAGISANIKRARDASIKLWREGWAVFCPHSNTAHFDGLCSDDVWLKGDLEMLKRCDAVYVLNGWRDSVGTMGEVELASKLGIEIIYEETTYENPTKPGSDRRDGLSEHDSQW